MSANLQWGRVLITGGAGFIGSHLAKSLAGRAELRVLDNFRTGRRGNLAGLELELELREGSILEPAALRAAVEGVDTVVHLAAMVSVPESMRRPGECHELNGTGTLRVLEAAAEAGVRRFIFASSSAVYGNNAATPKTETMRPEPESPYAITKLLGEHYAAHFAGPGRMSTVSLRFFNVFGPRQDPDGPYAAAVAGFLRSARTGAPLIVHGDGGQTRDFVYVRDVAAAVGHFMQRRELTGVFNIGYGSAVSVRTLAERILGLTGSASEIIHQPTRAGDLRHSLASVEALKASGFQAPWGFERGLRETVG